VPRADTGDLLDLLPWSDAEDGAPSPAATGGRAPAPHRSGHAVTTGAPIGRELLGRSLDRAAPESPAGSPAGSPTGSPVAIAARVAAEATAAALDSSPWPDPGSVDRALAEPLAVAAALARLDDRVLGATAAAAVAAGRCDVAWLLAMAPRPVPFYVRLAAALGADPAAGHRLAHVLATLTEAVRRSPATGVAGVPADPVATATHVVHRVPALTVAPATVDVLVDLLVAARRRGPNARGLVDAVVGLLARLERPASRPAPPPSSRPLAVDRVRVAEARGRQAGIDGARAAAALLTELESYPPTDRDPRAVRRELVLVAAGHGLEAIGERGEEVSWDPNRHELLDADPADVADLADVGTPDDAGDLAGPAHPNDPDDESEPDVRRDPNDPGLRDGRAGPWREVPDRRVRVVRSGYTWAHDGEVVVLQRALVRLVDPG
jgi:hypothetical protein